MKMTDDTAYCCLCESAYCVLNRLALYQSDALVIIWKKGNNEKSSAGRLLPCYGYVVRDGKVQGLEFWPESRVFTVCHRRYSDVQAVFAFCSEFLQSTVRLRKWNLPSRWKVFPPVIQKSQWSLSTCQRYSIRRRPHDKGSLFWTSVNCKRPDCYVTMMLHCYIMKRQGYMWSMITVMVEVYVTMNKEGHIKRKNMVKCPCSVVLPLSMSVLCSVYFIVWNVYDFCSYCCA